MTMYSLGNVFTQSPEKVKITALSVLGVIAGVRGWDPNLLEAVGVGIAIERTLDLFYVAPVRTAQIDAVIQTHQDEKDAAALSGIALGRQIAGAPPVDVAAAVIPPIPSENPPVVEPAV
jgi:hypothetical protein